MRPRIEPLEARIAPAAASIDLRSFHGVEFLGESAEDGFASSLSGEGDVNGDGFADLIIGASSALSGAGTSYVLFGKANGFGVGLQLSALDGADGFKIVGEAAGDYSGGTVSSAGDVNGDGFADLLIGASGADANNSGSGASYVVFGKASGFGATLNLSTLDGSNGFKMQGRTGFDFSFGAMRTAGDVNGDGFADLIIGAPEADPNGDASGASYVVFGKPNGFPATMNLSTLDGTRGFIIQGEAAGDRAGTSVNAAGDVNGDGFADLLVGTASIASFTKKIGTSYLIFGKASGFSASFNLSTLDGSNGFKLTSGLYEFSSHAVSSAGDVNDDGFDDILIGARKELPRGEAYVVFGKAGGFAPSIALKSLNGSDGFIILGDRKGARAGDAVSAAGDVNGDGIADILIGDHKAGDRGKFSGAGYVIFGKTSGFKAKVKLSTLNGTNGFRIKSKAAGDFLGTAVSGAGDVDGDGFDDILVGTAKGAAYLVFSFDKDSIQLAANGKSVTYTDLDGDRVTIATSKGTLGLSQLVFAAEDSSSYGSQLNSLSFAAQQFTGANITITAKPGPRGGDGRVNIGTLDATGVNLGTVNIDGDIGHLNAATESGPFALPALRSLTVRSIGMFDANAAVFLQGALPKLAIREDLRAAFTLAGSDAVLGAVTIGGSIVGGGIYAKAAIEALTVGGDIRSAGAPLLIATDGVLGVLKVGGSVLGTSAAPVQIRALSEFIIGSDGEFISIGKIAVAGNVEFAQIAAGVGSLFYHAYGTIGSITVGGDWTASTAIAGVGAGVDGKLGTNDDARFPGANSTLLSRIGSILIKGRAYGTAADSGDMFGIVAERIGKAKIGTQTFAFTPEANEAFFAATTGPGAGTESPAFDFIIRELISTTPM